MFELWNNTSKVVVAASMTVVVTVALAISVYMSYFRIFSYASTFCPRSSCNNGLKMDTFVDFTSTWIYRVKKILKIRYCPINQIIISLSQIHYMYCLPNLQHPPKYLEKVSCFLTCRTTLVVICVCWRLFRKQDTVLERVSRKTPC